MYHYTYLLRHNTTNLLYIGVRSSHVKPHLDSSYRSSSKAVSREFLLNCRKSILKQFSTREEANTHEIYLHAKFNVAKNPKFFNRANATSELFTLAGTLLTDTHKQRISQANKVSCNTPEVKEKYRQAKLGTKVSAHTKQLLRELNLGSKSAKARQVLCVETGIVYGSFSEAGIAVNIHYSSIVKACRGFQQTAGGCHWKYFGKEA